VILKNDGENVEARGDQFGMTFEEHVMVRDITLPGNGKEAPSLEGVTDKIEVYFEIDSRKKATARGELGALKCARDKMSAANGIWIAWPARVGCIGKNG
jgi:hypothetical protein